MNTMWKYPLRLADGPQSLQMPGGAIPLHVEMQDGAPTFWAYLDSENPLEQRLFIVLGTGYEIPMDAIHIGTCMDRCFVWHIFEVPPETVKAGEK